MMVVHEDNDRPMEVPVIKKPLLEQKSYVIVKNHVRELPNTTQNISSTSSNEEKTSLSCRNEDVMKKKRKSVKMRKKAEEITTTSSESDIMASSNTKIVYNDLEELRTVYTKCKEVMRRIETKYGHLLNLECESESNLQKRKRKMCSETSGDECNCKIKKKIVFDEDGRQSTVDMISDNHICVNKMKNAVNETQTRSKNIAIEYQDADLGLPDDLQTLTALLHNPDIEKTYRNQVLDKIRTLKQEYINEIRFNKHILIEKLKSNPDDILEFKGSNLSSIPGYS